MRAARIVPVLLLLAVVAAVPACGRTRNCVPGPLTDPARLTDLSLPPDAHAAVSPGTVREVEAEFRRMGQGRHPPGARPYHFLALSGGGLYAAFGVGVMHGWTASGTRPEFDVVTGISAGALMGTFVFLGPQYDDLIRQYSVGVELDDFLRRRPVAALPFSDAFFSSRRFSRTIEDVITPQVLCEVARAHAAGRRFYVGTTNVDSRRLIIWDMGEIASRGTSESAALYRDVVLASASVPGVFPPVRIPVEIDGRRYEELHSDGGVSDGVIFRSFMVADLNRQAGLPGQWAPPGSTLYVINNSKLYADPDCIRPRVVPLLGASYRTMSYGKTRDELYRIYLNCLATGVGFRSTEIPRDLPLAQASLRVPFEDQERIFAAGFQIGTGVPNGPGWRDLPAGSDESEQALPRAGTRFTTAK